mmetsp:Transcript_23180/g.62169  ORF Transcript_23180/g.62169 Transcript_23180/m.62169 type:complete len:214 (-) Transcript_23180:169-810(-)
MSRARFARSCERCELWTARRSEKGKRSRTICIAKSCSSKACWLRRISRMSGVRRHEVSAWTRVDQASLARWRAEEASRRASALVLKTERKDEYSAKCSDAVVLGALGSGGGVGRSSCCRSTVGASRAHAVSRSDGSTTWSFSREDVSMRCTSAEPSTRVRRSVSACSRVTSRPISSDQSGCGGGAANAPWPRVDASSGSSSKPAPGTGGEAPS